jgi:hypothetical protein
VVTLSLVYGFGFSAWYASFGERYVIFGWIYVLLFFSSRIILAIRVKVLGGGLVPMAG